MKFFVDQSHDQTPLAVLVARGALMEVGRPDLAAKVEKNKHDLPMIKADHGADREVITRAFLLGHKAIGHDARLSTWNLDGILAIACRTCWDRLEAA